MKKHNIHPQQRLAKKIVRRKARRGAAFATSGAILWATSSACGQFLMQTKGFDSEWLASVRIIIAGVILSLIGALQNRQAVKSLFKNTKDVLILAAYGIFGLMLAQFTFLKAVDASNSGTATVLQYLAPVMIIIFVCITNLKMPTFPEAVSIVLAVTGVFLLATHGNPSKLAISKAALFWGLLAALGFMIYSILAEKIIPKYGSMLITGLGMVFGGIVLLFIVRPWRYEVHFDAASTLAFIGLVFTGTTVGYTLYMQGVSDIGPVKSSMMASIEPVCSTVLAAALGSKFVWWQDYAGIACIVATVIILSLPAKHIKVSIKPSRKKGPAEKQEKEAAHR